MGPKPGSLPPNWPSVASLAPLSPLMAQKGSGPNMLGHPVQWEEEGWGEPYSINDTRFKFFPSQGGTQGPTGLAVELHSQVSPEAHAAIHLELPDGLFLRAVHEPEKWNPQTRETADHSIPYLVAVALHDGRDSCQFQPATDSRPGVTFPDQQNDHRSEPGILPSLP